MSAVRNRPRPHITGPRPSAAGVLSRSRTLRVLQLRPGVDSLRRRDLRPEAVAAHEDREFVLALPQLLHLGLLVGRPAGGGGAFHLAPAVVVTEPVQGLDRPG